MSTTVHERFPLIPATVLTALAAIVVSAILPIDPRSWYLVSIVVTLAWIAWLVWIWPRVTTAADDVTVRNAFTTGEIPYGDVDSIRAGLTLQIHTKSGLRVTAFGVHGRTGMGREAIRTSRAHGDGFVPVRRVDDLRLAPAGTQAERVAQIIEHRIEQSAPEPHTRPRSVRRISALIIAVTIGLIVVDVVLLSLPLG